jgi:hypothetical protein
MVCLVDTYKELGAALLPYLDSTQLQLVTAYANRRESADDDASRQFMGIDCRRCSGRMMMMQAGNLWG